MHRLLMLQVLTKSGRDIQYMEDKIGTGPMS